MGWLQDLLQEVPLSAVLKERVALAEQQYERATQEISSYQEQIAALKRENEALRARLPAEPTEALSADTTRLLVCLFKAPDLDHREVGVMARQLGLEGNVLQYHLDRLDERKLAEMASFDPDLGHVYWALTPEGRRYVVERKLI